LDPHLVLMDPDPGGPKHTDLTNPSPDPGTRHWIKIVMQFPVTSVLLTVAYLFSSTIKLDQKRCEERRGKKRFDLE
jgi:hypothetical protein